MPMDHRSAVGSVAAESGYDPSADRYLLPSRSATLERCRLALGIGRGPLLISGEAGSGKTWLWRCLADRLPAEMRTIALDATPATGPAGLFRAIAGCLGISGRDPRQAVREHLEERAAEGQGLLLVVDEAHALADAVCDELRILSNRVGQPDGFGGMILVGQTSLLRRLSGRSLTGLATRLFEQVHLRPVDADEACALLAHYWPRRHWRLDEVEPLHRDAAGNPLRLLRLAQNFVSRQPRRVEPPASLRPAGPPTLEPEPETKVAPVPAQPLLGASRPPLHEEEGLIEVGWEPEVEDGPAEPIRPQSAQHGSISPQPDRNRPGAAEAPEETVNDHYAALQAWNEWAQNQGRTPHSPTVGPSSALATEISDAAEEELRADGEPSRPGQPQFWAEGPGTFAPYSQLFSRLRPSKDAG